MRLASFSLALLLASSLSAELSLPHIISDGMVVQRELPAHIWGWAEPGEEVRVSLGGQSGTAKASDNGKWSVYLKPINAGGPYEMKVSTKKESIVVTDIYSGDVWVCSGQSNMEATVFSADRADEFISQVNDPLIRHFKIPKSWAEEPSDKLAGGSWEAASPESLRYFTAVGYHFARSLRESTGVPIGLVNSSWGGTRIEPWISQSAGVFQENALQTEVDAIRARVAENTNRLTALYGELPRKDAGLTDSGEAPYADPGLNDSKWHEITVPSAWEEDGFEGYDGIAWYRFTFELPSDYVSQEGLVGLANIDDADRTWVNGVEVGGIRNWIILRRYPIPAGVLKPGHNVVAVRVQDDGSIGGMRGEPEDLFLETAGTRIELAGKWKFLPSQMRDPSQFYQQLPTALYNKMIHPIQPYPIKGVIWYQGESNANERDASKYGTLFEAMIRDWRNGWGVGDFPFLHVQLSSFLPGNQELGVRSAWAVLREQQSNVLALPNTGQAVIIDIGDPADIHPANKHDVGSRLALAARAKAYREDIVYSGPVYDGSVISGNRVILDFNHTGSGLAVAGEGELQGFVIAGKDKVFHPAKASVSGSRVEVYSSAVPEPVAVRYAWANSPMEANLINAEGLPASPFRTDKWEDATEAE